ncbi:hypothetical protein E2C01_038334 [Portunus trituberculatus]|uniref:Uncharacterized protein n=1 Tax=Portunus trituberculatus TaxID=210409 RepID=A0A5B7FGY6_PORTR|nr:hypothetical protein [Portunus trituberculatus]
MGVTDSTP